MFKDSVFWITQPATLCPLLRPVGCCRKAWSSGFPGPSSAHKNCGGGGGEIRTATPSVSIHPLVCFRLNYIRSSSAPY